MGAILNEYSLSKGETSVTEIADAIFNSDTCELNDLLLMTRERGYAIDIVVKRITQSINHSCMRSLQQLPTASYERRLFLILQIKQEIQFYLSIKRSSM